VPLGVDVLDAAGCCAQMVFSVVRGLRGIVIRVKKLESR
jgi:hypothetical protein